MIFIEGNCDYKKKVKYEFTYLDYLYYCDRENWKRVVKGEYPIINEEENTLSVGEESAEYVLSDDKHEESKQREKTGDKKHDKK